MRIIVLDDGAFCFEGIDKMADGLKKFGDKVRAKLATLDRNQAWLSEQIETSPSQLSKWLNEGNQPGHPYLLRMSDTLGTSINFLIDDRLNEEPKPATIGDDIDSQIIMRFVATLGPEEVAKRIMQGEKARDPGNPVWVGEKYGDKKARPATQGKKAGNGH